MNWKEAALIASGIVDILKPHCQRIEIGGSIRRQKPDVKDIEIICIPRSYETGLFESGIASVVNRWEKVKGELPCKYTQRIIPAGFRLQNFTQESIVTKSEIKLDLFMCHPDNFGLIMVYRTGSAEFNMKWLQRAKERGYHMSDGEVWIVGRSSTPVVIREEIDLFKRIGMNYIEPKHRT